MTDAQVLSISDRVVFSQTHTDMARVNIELFSSVHGHAGAADNSNVVRVQTVVSGCCRTYSGGSVTVAQHSEVCPLALMGGA